MDKEKPLTDESIYPNEDVLKSILGRSYGAYEELLKLYQENDLTCEWQYYKDAKSWLCKVLKKKKIIVWMSAWHGYVESAIYLPERLVPKLLELPLADDVKEIIVNQENVGKSKPCIFNIKAKKSIKDFEKVMQFRITAK